MDSVRVAVRVRPFNKREVDLNSQLCISMSGKKTIITNPKPGERVDTTQCDDVKEFTYDFSYWSFDPMQRIFHSQEEVSVVATKAKRLYQARKTYLHCKQKQKDIFQNLGLDVVDNAYLGYNACVFAYGQTGSGKTYTMMGTAAERGLIPRICYRLFDKMEISLTTQYRTEVSYLEIYNEQVKDLLQEQATHSLRVREHPRTGPYVEGLSKHLVSSFPDISELMERGSSLRTTASTGMNDTSSRSHAIFTINFTQAALVEGLPSEKTSKIHLVDLAGSERAKATGATGSRLREGAHINKSLVTLGSVISALAEAGHPRAAGRHAPFVPYRDSTLTWLLKDSLGGNAKTVMIAAISPADVNYGETLSTLRYAHRAKSIVNRPTINEDANVQLIRALREEISRLRALIEGSGESPRALELIMEKEARADEMTNKWMESWRETQQILHEQKTLGLRKSGVGVVLDSDHPHLIGIDDDLTSTGITLYQLKSERTSLGAAADNDIVLEGGGIADRHCVITLGEAGGGELHAVGDAVCSVDDEDVEGRHRLTQGCVITLGESCMFRYNSPAEAARLRRAGVRRSSSRLSVLSRSTCDLAAARSVESLLAAEKRTSWGSSRDALRYRQPSEPALSRARLSVHGDPRLARSPPAGHRSDVIQEDGGGPEPPAVRRALTAGELSSPTGYRPPPGEPAGLQAAGQAGAVVENGAVGGPSAGDVRDRSDPLCSKEKSSSLQECEQPGSSLGPLISGSPALSRQDATLEPQDTTLELQDSTLSVTSPSEISISVTDSALASPVIQPLQSKSNSSVSELSPDMPTTSSSPGPPPNPAVAPSSTTVPTNRRSSGGSSPASGPDEPTKPPASPGSGPGSGEATAATSGHSSRPRSRLTAADSASLTSEGAVQPGGETADSEGDSLESPIEIGDDDELMSAFIEQEVQRRVSEQLAAQEQRLRAERAHQQLMNERQLARLHFTHQRQIRKLKSALSTVYSSVPTLSDQLEPLPAMVPEDRAVSSPRLAGADSPAPASAVAVPRYLLRGVGRDAHFEYEVRVSLPGERYTIYRRYQRFRELQRYVTQRYGQPAAAVKLPPAKLFGRTSEKLAVERRGQLEEYLRELLDKCSALSGCPLHQGLSRRTLGEFSPFFQRGVFEFTRAMTS